MGALGMDPPQLGPMLDTAVAKEGRTDTLAGLFGAKLRRRSRIDCGTRRTRRPGKSCVRYPVFDVRRADGRMRGSATVNDVQTRCTRPTDVERSRSCADE